MENKVYENYSDLTIERSLTLTKKICKYILWSTKSSEQSFSRWNTRSILNCEWVTLLDIVIVFINRPSEVTELFRRSRQNRSDAEHFSITTLDSNYNSHLSYVTSVPLPKVLSTTKNKCLYDHWKLVRNHENGTIERNSQRNAQAKIRILQVIVIVNRNMCIVVGVYLCVRINSKFEIRSFRFWRFLHFLLTRGLVSGDVQKSCTGNTWQKAASTWSCATPEICKYYKRDGTDVEIMVDHSLLWTVFLMGLDFGREDDMQGNAQGHPRNQTRFMWIYFCK